MLLYSSYQNLLIYKAKGSLYVYFFKKKDLQRENSKQVTGNNMIKVCTYVGLKLKLK